MATTDIEVAATGSIDHAPSAGTEQPNEQTEGQHEPSPRERMMQAIVERAEEARNRELAYGETMEEDARERAASAEPAEGEAPGEEADPAVAAAAAAVKDAVTPPETPKAEPTRHLITVGGQQFSVTDEEMRQLAEMGAVANIAIRQHGGQEQPAPQPQQAVPMQQQPQRQAPAGLDPEMAKHLHHKLTYGSEQEGIQAIQEMYAAAAQAAQPQQQIDPQRIAHAATNAALQQIQLQSNLNTIATEFPQVFADEGASQLAALKLHKIRQRDQLLGVQKPDLEAYREACRAVLDDARRLAGGEPSRPGQGAAFTTVQAAPFADRDARKRAAPRTPIAASRKAVMGGETLRAPSGSEIVEQMRKARFQPSMR